MNGENEKTHFEIGEFLMGMTGILFLKFLISIGIFV